MLATALAEPRRRAYLQALGVDLLRARTALPGATASVVWEEPLAEAAPAMAAQAVSAVQVATATPIGKPALAALPAAAQAAREALRSGQIAAREPLAPTPRPVAAITAPPAVIAPANAQPVARFNLLLVPISATHIALVDLDNQPALEGPEASLWTAICAAYGWNPHGHDLPAQFNWPIPGLAATSAAAQEALSGWLQTQQAELLSCVVFGEALSAVVAKPHSLLPSLAAVLAEPLRKRELMMKLHTLA